MTSRTASMTGVCSPSSSTATWLRPSPDSTRCPNPKTTVTPMTTRQSVATSGPLPGSNPSPRIDGHTPPTRNTTAAITKTAIDAVSTRSEVVSTRRTSGSCAGSSDAPTAFMIAAAMPRSANGSTLMMPTSSVYWA